MVTATSFNFDKQEIEFSIKSSDLFHQVVEQLKWLGCQYKPDKKCWTAPIFRLQEVEKVVSDIGDTLSIPELIQQQIDNYQDNLTDQVVFPIRRKYYPSLMKLPPIKDKNCTSGKQSCHNGNQLDYDYHESFQYKDFCFLIQRTRGLACHDTGMGKSWLLTALIEHLRYYGEINKVLIFSTGIGIMNLKKELIHFGSNQREEDILDLTSIRDLDNFEGCDLFDQEKYPQKTIIMTYNTFRYLNANSLTKDKRTLSSKTRKTAFDLKKWFEGYKGAIFLDEFHALCDHSSLRTVSFLINLQFFDYRYGFSATIFDKNEKKYTICKILDKGLVNDLCYTDWLETVATSIGTNYSQYGVSPNNWDEKKLAELDLKLSNYAIKRNKKDYLELPELYEPDPFMIKMSPKQQEIYQMFSNETVFAAQKEENENGGGTQRILSLFSYFQLAIDNPSVLLATKNFDNFTSRLQKLIESFNYQKDFNKLNMLDTVLKEKVDEDKERGIIFYYHPKTMEELEMRYLKYNPVVISTDVPMNERFALIENFKKNDKNKIIIASIPIMNTSLSIIECSWVFFIEKVYNYPDFYQACGRIYRPGQKRDCTLYSACFSNTIDIFQTENLKTKGKVLNSLLSTQITANVLKDVFNGRYC
jgi:superfamily II DNA or RNA helicase